MLVILQESVTQEMNEYMSNDLENHMVSEGSACSLYTQIKQDEFCRPYLEVSTGSFIENVG